MGTGRHFTFILVAVQSRACHLETNITKIVARGNTQLCTGKEELLHTRHLGLAAVGPDDCSPVQRANQPAISTGPGLDTW